MSTAEERAAVTWQQPYVMQSSMNLKKSRVESEQTGAGTYAIWIYNRKLCKYGKKDNIYLAVRKKKNRDHD